ncbi:MAG: DUF3489 domain-containing protein [Pseudomonadota bacterium]
MSKNKSKSKPKNTVKAALKTKAKSNGKVIDDTHLSEPMKAGLAAVAAMPRKDSKLGIVIKLLQRPEGATIDDLVKATGWQKHTVRSAVSHALAKKRGYKIVSDKPKGENRIYKIVD